MKSSLKLFSILWTLLFAITVTGQTSANTEKEFRSILGRFGIQLPQNYSDYKAVPLNLSGQKLLVSIYSWNIAIGQFTVSYAAGSKDLEKTGEAGSFLRDYRAQALGQASQESKLLAERQIDIEGHPGIELAFESGGVQTLIQVFVVKDRLYVLAMSLRSEQLLNRRSAITTFNSFRLLPAVVVDEELAKFVDAFAPEPLPQEPFVGRPTTDLQDEGLKGKVRKVTTEKELYSGDTPSGKRYLDAELEFNERGYLTRSVEYSDLPSTVIVYGYLNGERAGRIATKPFEIIWVTDKPSPKAYLPPPSKRKIETLKFKYKYNSDGQLLERRALFTDGGELERTTYDLKGKKMEHTGGILAGRLLHDKSTYLLDDSGNLVERDSERSYTEPNEYSVGSQVFHGEKVVTSKLRNLFTYEFDSQGNWIKRTTSTVEKNDGKSVTTPLSVAYRKIAYF